MIAGLDSTASPSPRRLRLVLGLAGLIVLTLLAVVYASRKVIAREALVSWLHSKGIAADAQVEQFGPTGFIGSMRIGDPARPDFAAETVDVRYAIKGFGVEVSSVTLRRPVLRGRLKDGKLSLGSLDPLIAEFMARPPRPDQRQPRIEVRAGRALIATPYGPADLTADALVDGGKLMRLAATGAPMAVTAPGFTAQLGASRINMNTRGDRVEITLAAPVASATAGAARMEGGQLTLTAAAPYPDLQKRRGDGAVVLNGKLSARTLALGDQRAAGADLDIAFVGQARGWIPDLQVTGRAVSNLRAASVEAGGAKIAGLKLATTAEQIDWRRAGGDTASAALKAAGGFDTLTRDDLTLRQVSTAFTGSVSADREVVSARLAGAVNGLGAWRGLGPVARDDAPEIAAIKRAAADFRIAAPGLVLAFDKRGPTASLLQPVRLQTARGGVVSVAPGAAGAYRIAVSGAGLPKVTADLSNLSFRPSATTARARVEAALSFGPARDAKIDAAGTLRIAGGGMSFAADRCVALKAARLDFGDSDIEALSGRLCPRRATPLIALSGGGWKLVADAQGVVANAPFLQARVEEAAGPVSFGMAGGKLSGQVGITTAQVRDTAPQTRFNPLVLAGTAGLSGEVWTADLVFNPPGKPRLGEAHLRHDGAAATGGVEIATGPLTLAEGGLQPAELSPLAAALGPPVTGQVEFAGRFEWTPQTLSSSGALKLAGLDFQSPAGRVHGMKGEIGFSSLAPLIAASGQTLTADSIDALAPLTNVQATFALEEKSLVIAAAEAAVGGGRVTAENLEVPLTPDAPMRGTLAFSGVQLHDLVEASPFGDKVELSAKVDGRIPFEALGGVVKVSGGTLKAVEPGRLSIKREALVGVAASDTVPTAKEVVPPNTVADFAYQAMENLAFDEMDATLSSQDAGRLGVRFHILGRHDPPQKQEIRLGLMDLIRRDFLNKPLPLPSGVKVDLTLDTSLNLDDLLRDYTEYQQLRSSPPVQHQAVTPTPPNPETKP